MVQNLEIYFQWLMKNIRIGMDDKEMYDENIAPDEKNDIIQDLTL